MHHTKENNQNCLYELPSGYLTWPWEMAYLQMVYLLKMVTFHGKLLNNQMLYSFSADDSSTTVTTLPIQPRSPGYQSMHADARLRQVLNRMFSAKTPSLQLQLYNSMHLPDNSYKTTKLYNNYKQQCAYKETNTLRHSNIDVSLCRAGATKSVSGIHRHTS